MTWTKSAPWGSSCAGGGDDDPRIKSIIFSNAGTSDAKPFLTASEDQHLDLSNLTLVNTTSETEAAAQPGAWVYYHNISATGGMATGHRIIVEQPERVVDMAVAWWKYMLNSDANAKNTFVGTNCDLCNKASDFEYGHNGLG